MIEWGGRLVTYPAETVVRYRSAGLWGTRPIGAEFRAAAARFPGHRAVVTDAGSLTYAELDETADRLALGLSDLGLPPGGRVVVQLTNRLSSVVAWYGLIKAGLIPVCTLAAHRGHEIGAISRKVDAVAHLVEHSATGFDLVAFARRQCAGHPTMRHVLTVGAPGGAPGTPLERLIEQSEPGRARAAVDAIQARIDPDDVAVFQLSGGTTGSPKVIPRLHAEYWYNARVFAERSGWNEDTRVAHLIPVIHNAGIVHALFPAHSAGGTLVLATAALDQALPLMARERATDALIGHGHYGIIDHPLFDEAVASMRRVIFSGAKVPDRLYDAFERRGVWPGQNFGMGEGLCCLSRPGMGRAARLTTVGLPLSPQDEFRVLAPGTEDELPDGETGELAVRGPYTIRGYFDAPDVNAAAFTSDGFYRTGDLFAVRVIDGDRCLSVEGRLKNLISRGGEKISPDEVEGLLVSHPGITAAAVVAMPDERLGERACAYLVAAGEPLTLPQVQAYLEGLSVAKFKWPERLEWRAGLPKTPVGKLDKKVLQQDIASRLAAERDAAPD